MKNSFSRPFFTGINYWDSANATQMWQNFDEAVIEADMRAMRAAGIDSLRVFPLWSDFQPLTGGDSAGGVYEFQMDGRTLPDTEAGRAGVSEEMCARFECFCALAEKHGLSLIVGLITGQMSFGGFYPPVFKGSHNAMSDPTMCKWQLRYIKYLVGRLKKQTAIVGWDLGNEVENIAADVTPDAFYFWCASIANAIRVADPTRPVISGFGEGGMTTGKANALEVGEYCDLHTVHPYNFWKLREPLHTMRPALNVSFWARLKEDLSGVPTFVQEFGAIGYMNCSYETEAAFYRGAALSCMAEGCHGVMWWCAFDQGHHTFAPYNWNTIGSQYGFFKADRTEKPIAAENRYLRGFADALPQGFPKRKSETCILIGRDSDKAWGSYQAAYIMAKQAGLDADFAYALNKIPDAALYLLACPQGYKTITKERWNELLEKVKGGARLLLTLSAGLFREVPETFGVCIDARYECAGKRIALLEGEALPVDSKYVFEIRPTTARVLARDETGAPVLFENDYGKGKTYLCTLPLEESVHATVPSVFFTPDAPAYYRVYERVARGMETGKISSVDSPYICRTEHVVSTGERYVFVINYDRRTHTAPLCLAEGWQVETVHGTGLDGGTVTLGGNDAVLLYAYRP